MERLTASFSIRSLFPEALNKEKGRKYLLWLISMATMMAILEFGQDYISSVLNNNYFSVLQSLSYKLFWFIFIPFSFLLMSWIHRKPDFSSNVRFIGWSVLIIATITLAHLLIFSLMLHFISALAYEEAWSMKILITEKLSTRTYISFSYYLLFSILYFRQVKKDDVHSMEKGKNTVSSIPVKNGQKTTPVRTDNIHWIHSDGAYLEIHTDAKKHVILHSLKHLIKELPDNFKRIHKSTIVNINYIDNLNSRGNGDYDVIMKCGQMLRLSRNYVKPLKGTLL